MNYWLFIKNNSDNDYKKDITILENISEYVTFVERKYENKW